MKYLENQHEFHPSQVFCQDDDGSGSPRYYDIAAMEKWARQNLPIEYLKLSVEHACFLLDRGAIDLRYYVNYSLKRDYAPIIVCLEAGSGGGTVIVDGNHRFVRLTQLCEEKLAAGEVIGIEAYLFSPEHWRNFVIPPSDVEKLGLLTRRTD